MHTRFRRSLLIVGVFIAVIAVALVVARLSSAYFNQQYSSEHHGCQAGAPGHAVVIRGGAVEPAHTTATKCDTMTITNQDDTPRLMAFGVHASHVPYDGIAERYLLKDQTMTVTLDQTGEFLFHDHLHDEVQGTFTVR